MCRFKADVTANGIHHQANGDANIDTNTNVSHP